MSESLLTDQWAGMSGDAVLDAVGQREVIEATLSGLDTAKPTVSIRDISVPEPSLTAHLSGPSDRSAVGIIADPPLKFPAVTVHATVNSGQPFTSVPHPTHDEDRHRVTLNKTGAPSNADTHFALYFRHH